MRKLLVLLAVAIGLVSVAPAYAQTTVPPYPGGTTTTVPAPTTITVTATFVNGTATVQVCGFAANTPITFSLNGGATFLTQNSDANGCITVTITIVTPGSALRARPLLAAIGLNRQLLAATNSTVKINGVTVAAKPPGQQNDLTLVGLGANGSTRTAHILFTVPGGGGLSTTGVMIRRWSLVALGLIAVGGLLVFADRRRHRQPGVR